MRIVHLSFLAGTLLLAPAAAAGQQPPDSPRPRMVPLAGARETPGPFAQRLVLPRGYCSALHTHDGALHGLVLRGTLRLGLQDSSGQVVVREYPAGSFVPVPAGVLHVEGGAEEVEIYVTGVGPLRTIAAESSLNERETPCTP